MSDAKKCDRCGEYYDKYRSYVAFSPDGQHPNLGGRNYVFDICPKCKSDFIDWMNTHQKVICMEGE